MSSDPLQVFVFLLAAVVLAGCASPAELRQRDEAACRGYGFVPGTPAFAACLQRENLARQAGTGLSFGVGMDIGF